MSSTLETVTWPVLTQRLSLRPGRLEDAEATWCYRREESVARWIAAAPATFDEYRTHFEQGDRLGRTVVVELDGEVIGDLMLRVEDAWAQADVPDHARGRQAELGWVIAPDHARNGYATEAVRELLRVCFEELGVRRVVADTFADNATSWRLMERVGMRRELHAVQEALHRSGEWLDVYGYALLASEWAEAGKRPPR